MDFKKELNLCIEKVRKNIGDFGDSFLSACGQNGNYIPVPNATEILASDWTSSFYSGMIWLAYENTKDAYFYNKGIEHIASFRERLEKRDITGHHDLGFLYILSCLAPYRICGLQEAKDIAIKAAYMLTERFQKKAGILQQSHDLNDKEDALWGIFIIDSLMNLPLLYWAAEVTGDKTLDDIARTHLGNVRKYLLREDGGTYQFTRISPDTGAFLERQSEQRAGKTANWARGQAWAIYGLSMSYTYTGIEACIEESCRAADFFLANLPEDKICAWDLCYTDTETQKDTSAAAIAVCGLLNVSDILPITDERKNYYKEKALEILEALIKTSKAGTNSNGLLAHGVYGFLLNLGVDEPQVWGDYFFMEALTRITKPWRSYWEFV